MDIALKQTTGFEFDIAVDGIDLQTDNGLRTAIIISLFTDALANADDDIPDGSTHRRGWWADMFDQQSMGSKLWLLRRSKQTQQVLITAREYCQQALQWMIDDRIVRRIEVETEWVRQGVLGINASIYKVDGQPYAQFFEYSLEAL